MAGNGTLSHTNTQKRTHTHTHFMLSNSSAVVSNLTNKNG